jgi:hypothetical protein
MSEQKRRGNRSVPTVELPLADPKSKHPSERLPQWAKPLPNEDTRKYAERLGFAIHQDSLDRSLRGDTAAHAKWREQALKGLGLGQRTEIDVSAHQDDKWLAFLTDVELEALETIHKAALQRMSTPPIEHNPDNSQALCKPASIGVHMLASDNVQSVKFAYQTDTSGQSDREVDGS